MIKFTIPVRPATKKNSGQIVMRGKYPVLIPSKNYIQFEKDCMPYLKHVKNEVGCIKYPVNVQCTFFVETRRRIDLPNLLNAIDDAMVKAELVIDDNRDIIAAHDGSRVYYDKLNPRTEITIEELKNYVQWKNTKDEQKTLFNN